MNTPKPEPLPAPCITGLKPKWGSIVTGFIEVTPKLARAWLKHNVKNRKLREDTLNGFARDINTDNWLVTHQGVAFNDRNELIDGQHRLEAIVRANKPAVLMATTNLAAKPRERGCSTMDVIDTGAPRSVANILDLQHGVRCSNVVATACKAIGNLCFPGRMRKATAPQTIAIMAMYRQELTRAIELRSDYRVLSGGHVVAACAFAMRVHPKETEEFMRKLNTGAGLDHDSPILHVREFLMSTEAKFSRSTLSGSRTPLMELTLLAILMFIRNRPCLHLNLNMEGAEYFRGKQPEEVVRVRSLFALAMHFQGPAGSANTELPPPSAKEQEYQKLRESMNIAPKEEEVEA